MPDVRPFELTNAQREYFGLDPVDPRWEKVALPADAYRPEGTLYFDGDTIKRRILSTESRYDEDQYDEPTRSRSWLLPKTAKGKPLKLTAAVLEKRQPRGPYLQVGPNGLRIGNYSTQTTFYSTSWHLDDPKPTPIPMLVERFVAESPHGHLAEIARFKDAKRRHVKFKPGDVFALKLDRTRFGFGRILLDVGVLRAKNLISDHHGLRLGMGHPVIVQLYAYSSTSPSLPELRDAPKLPSGLMMDNALLYGEYDIVGHEALAEEDFEFPMSYGRSIDARRPGLVFLQWGLIHRELPTRAFSKHLEDRDVLSPGEFPAAMGQNPFGFYAIGFSPTYGTRDILDALENGGRFSYERGRTYHARLDLRNPRNSPMRKEIMEAFGLDPQKGYIENCRLTGTPRTVDILRKL